MGLSEDDVYYTLTITVIHLVHFACREKTTMLASNGIWQNIQSTLP